MAKKKKITQAVILAGGKGTRLGSLTKNIPKPMIRIHGHPFLGYLVELLKKNGVKDILVLTGYLGEKITGYFGDGSKFGVPIYYHKSPVESETGTRLLNAKALLDDEFLLLYCDNYWPLNLEKLLSLHQTKSKLATMTVYANRDAYSKNNVRVEKEVVTCYDNTRTTADLNGVDVGFFILQKSILTSLPEGNPSFEKELLPRLVEKKQLAGFTTEHRYYTIGSLERMEQVEEFLKPKKIILLDRDGVINKKAPKADYVKKWSEFEFLPGAIEGLQTFAQNGYTLFILSNQAGIARGMMSQKDAYEINAKMQDELRRHGVTIKGIYICPHGWDEGCECRKPKPGMFFRAAREHHFDLTKTTYIGDNERDKVAAEAAGTGIILKKKNETLSKIAKQIIKTHPENLYKP